MLNIWMENEEENIQKEEKNETTKETEQKQTDKNRFEASVESINFNDINNPQQIFDIL